jgi:outer membrane protein assembly factor BamB
MRLIDWTALLLLATFTPGLTRHTAAQAPATAHTVDARAQADWPGYRGPYRDGVIRAPIRVSWDGLTPMWKKSIGGGRASFAIAAGRAFTIEQRGRNEVVAAYDVMTGRELWTSAWPDRFSQWMGGGEGPRATPTWADGHVIALGGRGELRCLDAESGKLVWRTNILHDAGAKNLRWGMAASPLIAGDEVIVLPGGPNGRSVAAYDRRTGKRLWTALDDQQAYVSPVQVTLVGVPQFLVVSAERLVGLSLDRREVLWQFPWTTSHDVNAAQPIVIDDHRIFYSSGYGSGAVVIELTRAEAKFQVRQIWRNIRMKNRQSSSIFHDGFIYGLDEGILACLDAETGAVKWKGGRYGHGQLLLAGENLIVITEEGELVLVAATPEKLQELARVPAIDGETWNVPAFADGILLVRNTKEMAAFDLRPDASRSVLTPLKPGGFAPPDPPSPSLAGPQDPRSAPATRSLPLARVIPSMVGRSPWATTYGARGYRPILPAFLTPPVALFEPNHDGFTRQAAPPAQAQPVPTDADRGREFFVSWGYNGDAFAKSDIHFKQPSLGNDFTLIDVEARDSKAWTDGPFSHSLFVPQYNLRFGLFFDEKWGLEVALDHIKWIVKEDQEVRMTGTMNGAPVDAPIALTEDVLRYQLNNGANPIFFNLMRRYRLAGERGRTWHTALLLKAGGGFAVPHTENTLFGEPNEKGFQAFKGWNLDAGAAARIHFYKLFYFEFEDKFVYARYFGVNVDRGTAGHSLKANEFSFHFGASFW